MHARLIRLLFRGFTHSCLEFVDQLIVPSVEKFPHIAHLGGVFLSVDVEHARCGASFDLVLKTRPDAVLELGVGARAQLKMTVHQSQGLARRCCRMVRPKVHRAIGFGASNDFDARPVLLSVDSQRKVVLIVFEFDVIAGLVTLYKLLLEENRFFFRACYIRFNVRELRFKKSNERTNIACARLKIAANTIPQIAGLADVQNISAVADEDIDTC